jgi:hypothetical protein
MSRIEQNDDMVLIQVVHTSRYFLTYRNLLDCCVVGMVDLRCWSSKLLLLMTPTR